MAAFSNVYFNFNILLLLFFSYSASTLAQQENVISEKEDFDSVPLLPNEPYMKDNDQDVQIFCYESLPKSFLRIWRSVYLLLENVPRSYEVCSGINASVVRQKIEAKSFWNPSTWLSGQKTSLDFPAFSPYCAGIRTTEKYTVVLNVRTINYWRVLQTVLGILLFLSAPSLSRNPFFHYTSGVSFGVLASVLIFVYVLSRFIPKKSVSYAILAFGYSFMVYMLQVMWQDLNDLLLHYMDVFLAYCLLSAFVSFVVCYRMGPVQNVRTFNIIQWTMQIIAVILIYLSSEYREVSTACILLLITAKIIPSSWTMKAIQIWYRFFPPRVQLLSELQYVEQGHEETKKALEELRRHCSSPDCNAWKTVGRLKDPYRFAQFVETGSHCTDDELLHYNSEGYDDFDEDEFVESANNSPSNGIMSPFSR